MKVLFAAAEAAPFAKNGGLGDVVGSLPKELRKQGIDARVMMPKYSTIGEKYCENMQLAAKLTVSVGWRRQYCGILEYVYEGVPFYFVDNEYYFARPMLYGYYDEAERYAFFSRAILDGLPELNFYPDVLQLNDWHTGMVAALLAAQYQDAPGYRQIKTLFTIHNLSYQGIYPHDILDNLFGLDDAFFTPEGLEFYGQVNFMKAGLIYSDMVNTVSQSYAREICTPDFGEHLDRVLTVKKNKLYGIVNGIDDNLYNPMHDKAIFVNYHRRALKKRLQNKLQLQKLLGLPEAEHKPLFSIVSRLVASKGFDLIACIAEKLLAKDVQLAVLGTGENRYEETFRRLGQQYPDKVAVTIAFDDQLARKIYAGSDIFLMPSQFEPCGVGQLIAMRYGAVPVVRETGGLKDTVTPYDPYQDTGSGFMFSNYNAQELFAAVDSALALYQQPKKWAALIERTMKQDFSWKQSAERYGKLYNILLGA